MPADAAIARRLSAEKIEDSIRVRALVALVVMIAMVALIAQGAVNALTSAAALVLTPVGYMVSYRRRRERNVVLKAVLAGALLVAMGAFVERVRVVQSVDDARIALASLFIAAQVIHAFDVPRRRDLAFSTGSSLILMAEAGSISLDASFGLFVIPYLGAAGAWLYASHRSAAHARASAVAVPARDPRRLRARGRAPGAVVIVALLAGGFAFAATPRLKGARFIVPPFSITKRIPVVGFNGGVVNPGLAARRGDARRDFSAGAYPGFGDRVDLRGRGHLSARVVMKVRAPQAAFWRAQAYDSFDGTTWTASDTFTEHVSQSSGVLGSPFQLRHRSASNSELVQTFYILTEQPNVVFAAFEPEELYFPSGTVQVDTYSSIRAPFFLEEGTVYSVISRVPDADPDLLRAQPAAEIDSRYLQLPPALPARVVELARAITADAPTQYDKVIAVQRWLRENTRYNIDISPDPAGVDAVDWFLFERREGFCEQIASAMVLLLRAVGVPARFAVGYDSGERNLFTGYFEVRESDAHSWVEVQFASGWVQYDPTHEVPLASVSSGERFIAGELLAALGRFARRLVPAPVESFVRTAARALGGAGVATGLSIVFAAAVLALARRRRRAHPPLAGTAAAFVALCEAFAARGHVRAPSETAREYLDRILEHDECARAVQADAEEIVRRFERARFASGGEDVEPLDAVEHIRRVVRAR